MRKECGDCDGCGWNEGGTALQSRCKTCDGTGMTPSINTCIADLIHAAYEAGEVNGCSADTSEFTEALKIAESNLKITLREHGILIS